jgi:serine protease Do
MVGLVTRKLLGPEDQASAEGYGLAIPSNDLQLALDGLMDKGRPQPYLGVSVEDWPERYWLKQQEPDAAVIKGVTRASPAERAGLKMNDIIEAVDGERIANRYDFWRRVRLHKVGDALTLTIRPGRKVQVVLTDLPESAAGPASIHGVTVRRLHPIERSLLNLEEATGLRVEAVDPASPLASVLSRGMNILDVGTPDRVRLRPVATPEEFRKELEGLAGSGGVIHTGVAGVKDDGWLNFPPLR